jgi:hypothetical protein
LITRERVSVKLLRQELESWRPFVEALRFEDRQVARQMMESCWRYIEAIEASGKDYVTEPFFLTLLTVQERRLRTLELEFEKMEGEVRSWASSTEKKKKKAGF